MRSRARAGLLVASMLSLGVVIACGPDPGYDPTFPTDMPSQSDLITVEGVRSRALGSEPFRLDVTTVSGLEPSVVSSSPDVCEVLPELFIGVLALGRCDLTYVVKDSLTGVGSSVVVSFAVLKAQRVDFDVIDLKQPWPVTELQARATSSVGLTVTYATESPSCTVDPATGAVTALNLGPCEITAQAAESAEYAQATTVLALEIVAGEQTIVITPLGDVEAQEAARAVAATAQGPVTISAGPDAVCSLGPDGLVPVGAGTCSVVAEAAATSTYLAGQAIETFEVLRRADRLTISAADSARYGQSIPLEVTSESGRAASVVTDAERICRVDPVLSELVLRGVGDCLVTAQIAADPVWDASSTQVAISISPALQDVTVTPITKAVARELVTLDASTNGDGALTYDSLTDRICEVTRSRGVVTLLRAGECRVAATAAATTFYERGRSVATFLVSRAPQQITFDRVSSRAVTVAAFDISATASSGLPVGLSTSSPSVCTVTGMIVSLKTVGRCTLIATQPGNDVYAPATSITQSFSVTKAAQELTFPEIPRHGYADPNFTVTAIASSGLPVVFSSLTVAVCRATKAGVINLLTTGTCTIKATQAGNGTYQRVTMTRTFESVEGCEMGIPGRIEYTLGRLPRAC